MTAAHFIFSAGIVLAAGVLPIPLWRRFLVWLGLMVAFIGYSLGAMGGWYVL